MFESFEGLSSSAMQRSNGQRLVDPLPFEFLRLPSVNATGNYHSRHCRPLLSRLRIIIVLRGGQEQKKFIYRGSRRWIAGDRHELFSEIDSFGKSRPRLRVIRVFATGALFLCLSADKLDRINGFRGRSKRSMITATTLPFVCRAIAEDCPGANLFGENVGKWGPMHRHRLCYSK